MLEALFALVPLLFFVLLSAAAIGKVDHWDAWKGSTSQLFSRIPSNGRGILAIGIPFTEALIAVVVLVRPGYGLVASSLLLAAFAIGVNILVSEHTGRTCNCLGALSSSRISRSLAIQDGILSLIALFGGVVLLNEKIHVSAVHYGVALLMALEVSLLHAGRDVIRAARKKRVLPNG